MWLKNYTQIGGVIMHLFSSFVSLRPHTPNSVVYIPIFTISLRIKIVIYLETVSLANNVELYCYSK